MDGSGSGKLHKGSQQRVEHVPKCAIGLSAILSEAHTYDLSLSLCLVLPLSGIIGNWPICHDDLAIDRQILIAKGKMYIARLTCLTCWFHFYCRLPPYHCPITVSITIDSLILLADVTSTFNLGHNSVRSFTKSFVLPFKS